MRRVHEEILRLLDGRAPFAVATVVAASGSTPGKPGFKLVLGPDGATTGTVGGGGLEERVKAAARAALDTRQGGLHTFRLSPGHDGTGSLCGGTVQVAVEVLAPTPHLLLVGGGHIAKAVHDLAHVLGWRVTVVDDRPGYVDAQRFPHAAARVQAGPGHLRDAGLEPYSHLVIATYSHAQDLAAVRHALERGFPGPVGVVGSRAKRARLERLLAAAGAPMDRFAQIECPTGLDIGAESPAEIALALLAGILEHWRRHNGVGSGIAGARGRHSEVGGVHAGARPEQGGERGEEPRAGVVGPGEASRADADGEDADLDGREMDGQQRDYPPGDGEEGNGRARDGEDLECEARGGGQRDGGQRDGGQRDGGQRGGEDALGVTNSGGAWHAVGRQMVARAVTGAMLTEGDR